MPMLDGPWVRFFNDANRFIQFNAPKLLFGAFVGLSVGKIETYDFHTAEPDDPLDSEFEIRQAFRLGFKHMGLPYTAANLRFKNGSGEYVTVRSDHLSFNGPIMLITKPLREDMGPELAYAFGGHEAAHVKYHHKNITTAMETYVALVSFSLAKLKLKQLPTLGKFPTISAMVVSSITTLVFTHLLHSKLELIAHEKSAEALRSAGTLFAYLHENERTFREGVFCLNNSRLEWLQRVILEPGAIALGQPDNHQQMQVLYDGIDKNLKAASLPGLIEEEPLTLANFFARRPKGDPRSPKQIAYATTRLKDCIFFGKIDLQKETSDPMPEDTSHSLC